jgi:DnaK suppressor protein
MYAPKYFARVGIVCDVAAANISINSHKQRRWAVLTPSEIKIFKDLLENQLAELASKAGGTMADLLSQSISAADPLDLTTMDSERSFTLRMRDRESKLIRKIKEALRRIEDGTYGECEGCGADISTARLQARPVATYCIRCKTKMESLEKMGLLRSVA